MFTQISSFPQTGTLTEDGLDMWGVVPVSNATSPPLLARPHRDPRHLNDLHELKIGMASCHSLTLLNGELAGDPLDLKVPFCLATLYKILSCSFVFCLYPSPF